jgi:hypothetical protein
VKDRDKTHRITGVILIMCNHLELYQVEQAKREDVVRKASKT